MTTQTIDPIEVLALYGKNISERTTPKAYDQPRPMPPFSSRERELHVNPQLTLPERAAQHYGAFMESDSDQRLDYILSTASDVTEHDVNQLAKVTYQWLDDKARDRIRVIAQQHAETDADPGEVLLQWFEEEDLQRFYDLLMETKFPDLVIAACYALSEANGVAHAAYFIHLFRMSPRLDLSNIKQTPDEIKDDLRFINAK